MKEFVEDEKVQNIIEMSREKVKIVDSDLGITAGIEKITGLDPNKYYIVEEWDEDASTNDNPISVQFVTGDGSRSENLTEIGRVTGGTITGLTNNRYYRVRSAKALDFNNILKNSDPITPKPVISREGEIGLPYTTDTYNLQLSTNFNGYSFVKIPISPTPGSPSSETTVSGNIPLEGVEGTTTDYVFVNNNNKSPENFYVLRVKILTPSSITITVILSPSGDNPPSLNTTYSYSQTDDTTETFTVANAAQYDGGTITWYIDGVSEGTGGSFDLDKSLNRFKILGVYTITVIAVTAEGIPYSAVITVTVTSS